ncbi:MAG TPA: hypothetical protein VFC41_09735 [Anaerovoracaceae bacterium]|nr:hypothetical protein [Anaerovoracaceae bacterium]
MQNGSDADLLASEFVLPGCLTNPLASAFMLLDCVTYLPDRACAIKQCKMVKMIV